MILRLIIIFGVLLASLYAGIWLQEDPGHVVIMSHHWTIESTLWIALCVVLFIAISIHLLFIIIKNIARIPSRWHQWRIHLRLSSAHAKTKRGLIEFSEGHWQTAKKNLIAAAPNAELPLINYLTAARAAEELGDHALRDKFLHQALTANPEATIAIELTQAQLQLDNQQWEQALVTLQQLQTRSPNHPYVIKLLLRLYQNQANWAAIITLLPQLITNKLLTEEDLHLVQKQAYCHHLQDLIQMQSTTEIKKLLKNIPKNLRYHPEIITIYSQYLLTNHQDKTAELELRTCLQIQSNERLIQCYAHIPPNHANLPFIESEIQKNPNSAAYHLCLGQLFFAKELWGSAKEAIEKSIQLLPSARAYYVLGQLYEKLENEPAACKAYRQGLRCASGSDTRHD